MGSQFIDILVHSHVAPRNHGMAQGNIRELLTEWQTRNKTVKGRAGEGDKPFLATAQENHLFQTSSASGYHI